MDILIFSYLFIIGLALGSFVLAMVDRMHSDRDWIIGRSECENCKHKLAALDLVPVFSWVSTRGKCRYCSEKLSVAYPLTEIAVALAISCSYLFWPSQLNSVDTVIRFVIWIVALVIISGLFIFDIRWYLLPNKLIRPLVVLGLLWAATDIYSNQFSLNVIISYALSVLVGAGIFYILYIASKGKWIGDGDIRLGLAMGLFIGNPFETWLAIFIASTAGILVSIPMLAKVKSKNKLKMKIPFGPMLIIGLYITVLFGSVLIEWYKTNILYL